MSSPRQRSLQQRVAWSTGLAALSGALLVALLGGALAWTLALQQEDRRLRDGLGALAFELERTDGSREATKRTLEEEQIEVQPTGLRLSILRSGERVGGPAELGTLPGCHGVERGEPRRQCAVKHGTDLLIAEASLAPLRLWLWQSTSAMALAVAVVALLSAWLSRSAARAAIAPLEALRRSVARIDPQNPSSDAVRAPSSCVEVEQLRQEFEVLLTQLAESLGHARRFAFNAAHEWRTPLTALRAEVELLREEEASAPLTEPLGRVERHVLELNDRLERVLVLATPASRLQGEPVSLEATAQEVAAALTPERAARVQVSGDEGLVVGDASLLRMLLRNAVENALKFSQGQVRVQIERDDDAILTFVDDDGEGVDAEEAKLLFQPFFRGHRAHSTCVPGSGLGLALIAHIARMHGGDVRFDSTVRGARLRLSLPAWGTSTKPSYSPPSRDTSRARKP